MAALEEARVNVKVEGEIPPTQVQYPGQAAKRTFLQVWIPAVLLLVGVIPEIVEIIDKEAGEFLPPEFRAWMLGLSLVAAAIGSILSKVMSLAKVNDLLSKVSLAATPKQGRHEATATITMTPVAVQPDPEGKG